MKYVTNVCHLKYLFLNSSNSTPSSFCVIVMTLKLHTREDKILQIDHCLMSSKLGRIGVKLNWTAQFQSGFWIFWLSNGQFQYCNNIMCQNDRKSNIVFHISCLIKFGYFIVNIDEKNHFR